MLGHKITIPSIPPYDGEGDDGNDNNDKGALGKQKLNGEDDNFPKQQNNWEGSGSSKAKNYRCSSTLRRELIQIAAQRQIKSRPQT